MDITCNDYVGGGWTSLVFGRTGLHYDAYKLCALFAYAWKHRNDRANMQGQMEASSQTGGEAEMILEELLKGRKFGSTVIEIHKAKLLELFQEACEKPESMKNGDVFEVYRQFLLSVPQEELVKEEQEKMHGRISALGILDAGRITLEKIWMS